MSEHPFKKRLPLGRSGIQISPMGIGAWQWGARLFWDYGKGGYSDQDIQEGFSAALDAGINFFDTAEAYGDGDSERILGGLTRASGKLLVIATKFMPYPWRLRRQSVVQALRRSLKRLGLERVDLYQIHRPFPPLSNEHWVLAMADAFQSGLIGAVGVSNFSVGQTRMAYELLARRGIPLAANQVKYNLLERQVEKQGLLQVCRELGVTLIAYSPLAQGLLTGRFSPQAPLPGFRQVQYGVYLGKVQPLITLLRQVGADHGGKSPSQVALNWVMCKGAVPIPGIKNLRHAQDNIGTLDWRLTDSEIDALEAASDKIS